MSRALVAFLALAPLCCAQTLPAFRWIVEVDSSGSDGLVGLGTDTQGNVYLAGTTRSPDFHLKAPAQNHLADGSDVFVTKLDPSGNIVYSTYFGGSGDDFATAIAVDPQGGVYVTGTTSSTDFPTTPGAYSSSVPPSSGGATFVTFLFKLNPDGSVGYATYFSNSQTTTNAIAVDRAGFAYLTGLSYGGLVTTPGAYRTSCTCIPPSGSFSFFALNDAYLTRFDPTGSELIFSTYLGAPLVPNALAIAPDGSAYIAGAPLKGTSEGVFLLNATGTSLVASAELGLAAHAIALAPDGSLYLAGPATAFPDPFLATPGAFQSHSGLAPTANAVQSAIAKMDPQLHGVLAGTYFGGTFGTSARAITLDAAGNVYVGGYTSPRSLPTRTPFVQGFGLAVTGYVAELTGDLSALLFSSEFGNSQAFAVNGLAISANGNVVLGGATGSPQSLWVNSLALADPTALRIDAIEDSASHFSDPISDGETILIQGSGFGTGAQLLIGGVPVTPNSISPTSIVAIVPSGLPGAAAAVQVLSDGSTSNTVVVALIH
jgi:hypothetical protein